MEQLGHQPKIALDLTPPIEARLPRGISTRAIGEPDLEWSRQWNALGIGARAP